MRGASAARRELHPIMPVSTITQPEKFAAREGAVAQLGEHLVCNQGVVGSNPIRSMQVRNLRP